MISKNKYVDFYFYVCIDELLNIKTSEWNSNLSGKEIIELSEFLKISLNTELIRQNYWNENSNTIEIFHSKIDNSIFMYFDTRIMTTDQNDMLFFGVRCLESDKNETLERLLKIYGLLNSTGSFQYEKWGRKLCRQNENYLNEIDGYYNLGLINNHNLAE